MSDRTRTSDPHDLPPEWDRLTRRIIAAAIQVHRTLGPGMLEGLYEEALCLELRHDGLTFERQRPIAMTYRDQPIGDMRVDLIVESTVIVELKAIERVLDVHKAQLLSYLRSADMPLGLLINFNHASLIDGVTRRLNERSSRVRDLPRVPASRTSVPTAFRALSPAASPDSVPP